MSAFCTILPWHHYMVVLQMGCAAWLQLLCDRLQVLLAGALLNKMSSHNYLQYFTVHVINLCTDLFHVSACGLCVLGRGFAPNLLGRSTLH